MSKQSKRLFTNEEKQYCWKLWRKGKGFSDIAKKLNSKPGTVFGIICITGGYAPLARTRSKHQLTLDEREEISRGIATGQSIRSIAAYLSRSSQLYQER